MSWLFHRKTRRLATAIGALGLIAALAGCSTNRATGEDSFTAFMSPEQEKQVGAEEHPKIVREFGGDYDEKDLQSYVTEIGNKLVAVSEAPDEKFTFTVLDSQVINAFALPGGYVYITRGLAGLASNEAELAGVLAHEIGHVVARHSAQRYSRGVLTQILAGGLSAALGSGAGDIVGAGANAYLKSFSREHEFEADMLGVRYITRAGYDPEGMASFLKKLRAHSRLQAKLAGRSPDEIDQFDFMATHPRTLDRIEQAHKAANVTPVANPEIGSVRYMRAIDGIIYGDGPDNGYVRGTAFIHVPLDFRFDVPDGFSMINQPDAVIAQDDGGAQIVFEGAPKAKGVGLDQYLSRGFSSKIAITNIENIDINGQEAATGYADVNLNSGGKARLRVVVIRHGENAYQFLFITPLNKVDDYNVALRRTTYSFRPLTREEQQKYHPLRIKVRAVNPEYDLSTFVGQMAVSREPSETFAVLNGLEPGQPPATNSMVKVVID
ncbi:MULTISPECIES: M48 family metalloprotease [Thalassospira]|uniref:Zn-dependent protease n=1 Tax=Thalassospira xiamenensis TaxID=220697 RepID=A0A285TF50_9PROT|nr:MULTISPECIES: M48 family metalloprotease [Thalassospira]MBO9506285.1 M48 family metalloprotease [Thalassospira sp. A3_1]SOC20884.1 Putative Zn-dependent protease [Thalassospira xiamenensis]